MRINFLIVTFTIFFSLCSSVSGKDNRKEMRTIIDKGLNTAIEQSKQMAEKLLGQKDERLSHRLQGHGQVVFSPEYYGICMKRMVMPH